MKTLKKLALIVGVLSTVSVAFACAAEAREPIAPPVAAVGVDWWFDGVHYYYFDPATGLYFYYGVDGVVVWCPPGWHPSPRWFRVGHDRYAPVWRGGHPEHRHQ